LHSQNRRSSAHSIASVRTPFHQSQPFRLARRPLSRWPTRPAKVTVRATAKPTKTKPPADAIYPLWRALPLAPGPYRKTERIEIIPNKIYVLEQVFGLLDVVVNIRCTVVVLKDGSLFVYAPVAPTRECLRLVDELGPVKYIVLPTTAVEHKVFFGPFAKKYPDSKIYTAPGQWSLPLNLPIGWLGLFPRRIDGVLEDGGKDAPWADEFEQALLQAPLGLAPFVEVAFYHKPTRTLLVTDTVVAIPSTPPKICEDNPKPLLVRAKDNKDDPAPDTEEVRVRGWRKIVLFSLFIKPGYVDFSFRNFFGSFFGEPLTDCFIWYKEWQDSFANLERQTLLCPPILQALVLSKRPTIVKAWVAKVCRWNFQRVIPAHFTAPIAATPRDFRDAFRYLDEDSQSASERSWLPTFGTRKKKLALDQKDMKLFSRANAFLEATGVVKGEAEVESSK